MPSMHPDAVEHRRKRWIRPDAYRFAKPGSPEADPGFLHSWAEVARQEQAAADEAKAREAAEQESLRADLEHLHRLVKDLRIELALRALGGKYSPDQPRVPAGNPDGGQWTDGGGGGAELTDFSAQARRGGPSRAPLTPPQQARLDNATRQADAAVARVQQLDPNWQPTQSITNPNNAEGFIRAKEEMVREAEARFMALSQARQVEGFPPQSPQTNAEVLRPRGQFIGSGNSEVRTVSSEQFETVRLTLMNGARQIEPRIDYDGVRYQRQDGSIMGLRLSLDHGLTLDILHSTDPVIPNGFRVHQR
jgi:hypothetical protein